MGRRNSERRLLLTGPRGSLGALLLSSFSKQKLDRLVVVDLVKPKNLPKSAIFYKVDLTQPAVDEKLAKILEREAIDTVVHSAILWNPTRNRTYAHEVEVIGTINLLNAIHQQETPKLIVISSTIVYGAKPNNPNYLTEDHKLYEGHSNRYLRDKVELEHEIRRFRHRHPQTIVTVLRPCMVVGPMLRNFVTGVLSRPVIPTILGYDPLIQFLHELDFVRAVQTAVTRDFHGDFNLVGEGVLPMSYAIKLAGRINVPLLHSFAQPALSLLWHTELLDFPPDLLDFLRYLWVADGEKARKELGFKPKYTSKEAVESYSGQERLRRVKLEHTQAASA